MTRFFACVRTREEATAATAAGFDGVLGAVPAGAAPGMGVGRMVAASDGGCLLVLDGIGGEHRLQVFVDRVPIDTDLAAHEAGVHGVLVSAGGRILDAIPVGDLARITEDARKRGLLVAFGGGIEPPDVPRLLALKPDMLLFGRALRTGGAFDPGCAAALLALRPVSAGEATRPGAGSRDRIFVRGLVRPVAIGVYASERGRTQRVRFSMEAELDPLGHVARGMGDIVSYNLLADTVDRLIAGRHIDFVETLAEEIAARILQVPRIAVVRVKVEKLDLGAEAFGVEIERIRPFTAGGSASPAAP